MPPPASSVQVVAITGGSCSGKTTLAQLLWQRLGDTRAGVLCQDSYYIDQSARFKEDGGEVNFDHPNAIDWQLLHSHLRALKRGESVEVPIYDFVTHSRARRSQPFAARPIILVDGTLLLSQAVLRPEFSRSIFLDVPETTRFARRQKRDVAERGRTLEGVQRQFDRHVKPMHDRFVQPSLSHATRVVASGVIDLVPLVEELFLELTVTQNVGS